MYLCGERLFPATAGANRRRYAATVQGACVVNCLELELSPFACVCCCVDPSYSIHSFYLSLYKMSKRVCKTLTLAQRVDVLKRLENKESQSSIAMLFGVNQSQISRIHKNRDKIFEEWQSKQQPRPKAKAGWEV